MAQTTNFYWSSELHVTGCFSIAKTRYFLPALTQCLSEAHSGAEAVDEEATVAEEVVVAGEHRRAGRLSGQRKRIFST